MTLNRTHDHPNERRGFIVENKSMTFNDLYVMRDLMTLEDLNLHSEMTIIHSFEWSYAWCGLSVGVKLSFLITHYSPSITIN